MKGRLRGGILDLLSLKVLIIIKDIKEVRETSIYGVPIYS